MKRSITDDSIISGLEFRIRLTATGMDQQEFAAAAGVNRDAVFKWMRGPENKGKVFPLYAQKVLEEIEVDIETLADSMVKDEVRKLPAEPVENWPWGPKAWHVAMARARYRMAEAGFDAVIGEPAPGRVMEGVTATIVKVEFKPKPNSDRAV